MAVAERTGRATRVADHDGNPATSLSAVQELIAAFQELGRTPERNRLRCWVADLSRGLTSPRVLGDGRRLTDCESCRSRDQFDNRFRYLCVRFLKERMDWVSAVGPNFQTVLLLLRRSSADRDARSDLLGSSRLAHRWLSRLAECGVLCRKDS